MTVISHAAQIVELCSSWPAVIAVPALPEAQGVLFDQGHTGIFSTRASSQIQIAWGPAVHVDTVDQASVSKNKVNGYEVYVPQNLCQMMLYIPSNIPFTCRREQSQSTEMKSKAFDQRYKHKSTVRTKSKMFPATQICDWILRLSFPFPSYPHTCYLV